MKNGWYKVRSKTGLADYTYVSSDRMNYGEGEHVQRLPDGYTVEPAVCMTQGEYDARIAELEAIIAYIDLHAPLADKTTLEPGITLSQAAIRAIADEAAHSTGA